MMKLRSLFFFAVTTGFLSGCLAPRPDHTRFYFLSTPAPAPPTAAVERDKVFLIGLRMTSAEYLRTKQMIVELGPNQLRLSQENLWEETPQAGFTRVLAERLARNLPDCQLIPLPSGVTNQPEFVVEINLLSLQGRLKPRSEAEVSVEVRILDANSRLVEREELRQTSPWSLTDAPESYPALAAAESRAAADLADTIGRKILACHRQNAGR
jgi:uncharacterized lipoprotein YmbA